MRCILKIIISLLSVGYIVSLLSSCSTQKNTSSSRWWHSFNAKYNTYYNASLAYIEASLEKENGNKDNYTETLPLYTVSNKQSRELGKSNYETAITKSKKAIKRHSIKKRPVWTKKRRKTERDIEWLNRREYNPFLWKAWMLMGRSQFHSGAFDEAAATFSYMSRLYNTQPAIYGKARAWLAKCYIEQNWMYDAEDVIRNMRRDSIDWRCRKEWDYTLADYYLHTGQADSAALYLRRVVKHEMRKKQRAREWYILGQVYAQSGKYPEAYDAFRHVIRQNPPYELEFNARISMTEVMPGLKSKSKVARLRRMARSDKNKDYLDQVYYALGNIYIAERDTSNAIKSYEKGVSLATRSGIEKGVLLYTLGNLYWTLERFSDARRCYSEALGLLDKERREYETLSNRSKILDELVPHTESIHLQDSLQALAKMSEKDRNEAIDRVIAALKKKEKEERLAQLDATSAMSGNSIGQTSGTQNMTSSPVQQPKSGTQSVWYFYNPMAVQQGKQAFMRQWGKRPGEDNWRRINKTVVSSGSADSTTDGTEMEEETASGEDKGEEMKDSVENDPHTREFYLAQIPFTAEQLASSNLILSDALYNAGVIFKDKMENLKLSERELLRITKHFPSFEKMPDVYYHLFLLYSRSGDTAAADEYKQKLAARYPSSGWTQMITDPYFVDNSRYGAHREDSLYAETYEAFRKDDVNLISRNASISQRRYPDGANRPKFIFISGLSRLSLNDKDSCIRAMTHIVEHYPESEVAPLAGMIINGVKAGRQLHSSHFDISDIWEQRDESLQSGNDSTAYRFSAETEEEFCFLMTYAPDTLSHIGGENKLLYNISRHNFSSYLVRNFDIEIEPYGPMHRLQVRGFRNIAEAKSYARSLYADPSMAPALRLSRNIVISVTNLEVLGRHLSYNDYDKFYHDSISDNTMVDRFLLNEQLMPAEVEDSDIPPLPDSSSSRDAVEDNAQENPSIAPVDDNPDDGSIIIDNRQSGNISGGNREVEDGIIVVDNVSDKKAQGEKGADASSTVDGNEYPDGVTAQESERRSSAVTVPSDTLTANSPERNRQPARVVEKASASSKATNQPATTITSGDAHSVSGTAAAANTSATGNIPAATNTASGVREGSVSTTTQKRPAKRKTTDTLRQDLNADVIEIIDEGAGTQRKKNTDAKPKKKEERVDDEYFELEGF